MRYGSKRRRTGGGPFTVYSADGSVQPLILESTQLDPKKEKKLLKDATHFNPVGPRLLNKGFQRQEVQPS